MKLKIPKKIQPFLWSYDIKKLDIERDKRIILAQLLTFGTKEATDWMFLQYSRKDIIDVIKRPIPGMIDKKSLNFWALVLNVAPGNSTRKILK